MRYRRSALALGTLLTLALFGCEADVGKQLSSNQDFRDRVMTAIAADTTLVAELVGRVMASDVTQGLVIDRILANPAAVQAVMGRMAQDRTRVEGILNLAVQDADMRDHLMTLLKGMELGRAAPATP
jgi:hypothetical protein